MRIDINTIDFENNKPKKGITTYRFGGRFFKLLGTAVEVKIGSKKTFLNKNSLARYICEAYVGGERPLQHKQAITQKITEISTTTTSSPEEIVRTVLSQIAQQPEDITVYHNALKQGQKPTLSTSLSGRNITLTYSSNYIETKIAERILLYQPILDLVKSSNHLPKELTPSKDPSLVMQYQDLVHKINIHLSSHFSCNSTDIPLIKNALGWIKAFQQQGEICSLLREIAIDVTSQDSPSTFAEELERNGIDPTKDTLPQIEEKILQQYTKFLPTTSKANTFTEQLKENKEQLQTWKQEYEKELASFPNIFSCQVSLIENEMIALDRFSLPEYERAQKLRNEILAWKSYQKNVEDSTSLLAKYTTLTPQISALHIQPPETTIQAKNALEEHVSTANTITSAAIDHFISELNKRTDYFQQELLKLEQLVQEKQQELLVSECREKIELIDEMYLTLAPSKGTRSKLPHWSEYTTIQRIPTEKHTTEIAATLQHIHDELVHACSTAPRKVEKEKPPLLQEMTKKQVIRARNTIIKRLAPTSKSITENITELLNEIRKAPSELEPSLHLLLNKAPDSLLKRFFGSSKQALIIAALSSELSKEKNAILALHLKEIVETHPPLENQPQFQKILTGVSNNLKTDLRAALDEKDEKKITQLLSFIAHIAQESPERAEELLILVGKFDPEEVSKSLKDVFAWHPETTTELKEGLRSLAYCFANNIYRSEKGENIVTLAEKVGISIEPQKIADTKSNISLIFHAAPHTDEKPDVDKTTLSLHALRLGLARLDTSDTHPVFVGTEWAFSAQDDTKLGSLLDDFSHISSQFPFVTFIPGSIEWVDPQTKLCFNLLPIFEEGRLISLYSKRHEKDDMLTISGTIPLPELLWAATDPISKKGFLASISNCTILHSGICLGTEICNDHINLAAQSDYRKKMPLGNGLDIHLLIAHGSQLGPPRLALREGGIAGYIDHSCYATSTATRVKKTGDSFSYTNPQKKTNRNRKALGAFQTHQATMEETVPLFDQKAKDFNSSPCSLEEFFQSQEISSEAFCTYLTENISTYTPQKAFSKPSLTNSENVRAFFTKTLHRYTFSSEEEIATFIQKVREGTISKEYEKPFFRILADFLGRHITVYTDLTSLDKDLFSPIEKLALPELEIGFSYEKGHLCTVDFTSSEHYQKAMEEGTTLIQLWNLDPIPEQAKTEEIKKQLEEFLDKKPNTSLGEKKAIKHLSPQIHSLLDEINALLSIYTLQRALPSILEGENTDELQEICIKEVQNQQLKKFFDHIADQAQALVHFKTLQDFERKSKEWGGGSLATIWVDGTSLRTGNAFLRQNTKGVGALLAQNLTSLQDAQLSEKQRELIKSLLKHTKEHFPKDKEIEQVALPS